MRVQAALAAQRVPAAAGIVYLPLYPPQVSLFFAPFARMSYPSALALWLTLSSLTYLLCCYAIFRACPSLQSHKLTTAILALAFPAFWHLVAWGQTSALALACFTAGYFALRAQHEFLARPGTRMPHLQTSTSYRRRNRLRNYISLADYPRRDPLGPGTVNRSLALLWCGRGTRLDPYPARNVPHLLPLLWSLASTKPTVCAHSGACSSPGL